MKVLIDSMNLKKRETFSGSTMQCSGGAIGAATPKVMCPKDGVDGGRVPWARQECQT
jgi:hypothetical protein